MTDVHVESYAGEKRSWVIQSPFVEGSTTKNLMKADGLQIELFEGGSPSSTIDSRSGVFYTGGTGGPQSSQEPVVVDWVELHPGDFFLKGDVVVVSTEGTRLYTDWLYFDNRKGVVRSTAPVKMIRHDSVTTGVGIRATSNLSSVQIFNQTVVIKGEEETGDE